jgi:alcohol dehydrogenase
MIKARAAVLQSPTTERPFSESRPLVIEEVVLEAPVKDEVLVRIDAASLCRSDLSVITGVRAWPMPIVPGHEASATVLETGPDVAGIAAGDRVVLVYQAHCGHCRCCTAGDPHLCDPGLAANRAGVLLSGGPRLSLNGVAVHHHMGLSAFAEMAVVSQRSLVRVGPELKPEIAALFGCAVICGAGSVVRTGRVRAGDSVAIVGIGGVGGSAILGARLAGAARITAVDRDPSKLEGASRLGATDVVEAGAEASGTILEMTGGGVDCALETGGTLEAFQTAYACARRGGRVVTVGLVSPKTPFELDIAAHVTAAKEILGSYMGSCNPAVDIPRFVELYKAGRFPVDQLITHCMPLADINVALEQMAASIALRQIITP